MPPTKFRLAVTINLSTPPRAIRENNRRTRVIRRPIRPVFPFDPPANASRAAKPTLCSRFENDTRLIYVSIRTPPRVRTFSIQTSVRMCRQPSDSEGRNGLATGEDEVVRTSFLSRAVAEVVPRSKGSSEDTVPVGVFSPWLVAADVVSSRSESKHAFLHPGAVANG